MRSPLEVPGSATEPIRGLIDRLADGVLVVGPDGLVRYANPTAERLLARPAGDLVGAPFGHPVVVGESAELQVSRADGPPLTVELRVVEAVWAGELCAIASLRDVTARTRTEHDLARLHRELTTLHRIGQICLSRVSLEAAYTDIVDEIAKATSFEVVVVARLDDPVLTVLAGTSAVPTALLHQPARGSLAGGVARRYRTAVVPDLTRTTVDGAPGLHDVGLRSCIAVPMAVSDGVTGCLLLASSTLRPLPDDLVAWVETLAASVSSLTERVRVAEELQRSEARFRRLADHAADVIYRYRFHPGPAVEYVSPSAEVLTGHPPEAFLADPTLLERLVHPDDTAPFAELLAPQSAAAPPVRLRWVRRDGTVVWTEQRRTAVFDESGRPVAIEAIARDVTERIRFEERLSHQALHDALTGLPNRTLFVDRLDQTLERQRRRDGLSAVLFLDVDHFKVVNDALGHAVGDDVLVEVARRLRAAVRPSDTVARFGGDEFAVLLDDVASAADAVAAGRRILTDLDTPVRAGGRQVFVSGSVGLALLHDPTVGVDTALRHADVAMYRAKEAGRARLVVFDEAMAREAVDRLELDHAMRVGVARGELQLHFQPVVSVATGDVRSFEALLRWRHPERGLLTPDVFWSVVEAGGAVGDVTRWVLQAAVRTTAAWRRASPSAPLGATGVNLSARQLAQPDLVDVLAQELRDASLDGAAIAVEITEGSLLRHPEAAARRLVELHDLGVRIALDDFGTGYSSLSHLRHLPVDALKIDQSFVRGLGRVREDRVVVGAVLGLGSQLGLRVVAEGVETAAQRRTLTSMGCVEAQGHLWAPAVPADEAAGMIGGRLPTPPTRAAASP